MIENRTNSVVDTECVWMPIDKNTPQNKRILMINKSSGVATIGQIPWNFGNGWYSHWAPLPVFADE